jgi:hypothetical protein
MDKIKYLNDKLAARISVQSFVLVICLSIVLACSSGVEAQTRKAASSVAAPETVARFMKTIGPKPSGEMILSKVREQLWEVYIADNSLKMSIVGFLTLSPDSVGVAYAATALIPFHDPATVRPVVERAMDRRTSKTTRWYLLSAAPYILSVGDGIYMGDGALDDETREFAKGLLEYGDKASRSGLGHTHAVLLRELYDQGQRNPGEDPDYGLALWHLSAYLLGTLDLKDEAILSDVLDPRQHNVFKNLMCALSFAGNRDFLADLRNKEPGEVTPELERAARASALKWWQSYLREHPTGDWVEAAINGFRDSGYKIASPPESTANTPELLRSLNAESEIIRYNAYRLLNHIYGTHFDLQRILFADKYALSFLDPIEEKEQNAARLKVYWEKRLKQDR